MRGKNTLVKGKEGENGRLPITRATRRPVRRPKGRPSSSTSIGKYLVGEVGHISPAIQPPEIYERLAASEAERLLFLEWAGQGSAREKTEPLVYWKSRFLKPSEKTRWIAKETDCSACPAPLELRASS